MHSLDTETIWDKLLWKLMGLLTMKLFEKENVIELDYSKLAAEIAKQLKAEALQPETQIPIPQPTSPTPNDKHEEEAEHEDRVCKTPNCNAGCGRTSIKSERKGPKYWIERGWLVRKALVDAVV